MYTGDIWHDLLMEAITVDQSRVILKQFLCVDILHIFLL